MQPNFAKGNGLIPAIAQDYESGEILMLAYMNEESWNKTLETGKVHYYSRSRQELWLKGKSSGNVQLVKDIFIDCDEDTILVKVKQEGGAACHTGHRSCFFRKLVGGNFEVVSERVFDPKEVYKS